MIMMMKQKIHAGPGWGTPSVVPPLSPKLVPPAGPRLALAGLTLVPRTRWLVSGWEGWEEMHGACGVVKQFSKLHALC